MHNTFVGSYHVNSERTRKGTRSRTTDSNLRNDTRGKMP